MIKEESTLKESSNIKSEGIRMEHSVPYTPQQNGVAERKNISLKEMVTCVIPQF